MLRCQPPGPRVSLAAGEERAGFQDSTQELLQGLQKKQDVKDITILQNFKVFKDILEEPDSECVVKTVSREKGGRHKQGESEEGSASCSVSSPAGLSVQNTLSGHHLDIANIFTLSKVTTKIARCSPINKKPS